MGILTTMSAKQVLLEKIEELTEEEAENVLWYIEDELNGEPQPLTPEEIAHLREGVADLDAGRTTPHEEVLRRFGIAR